MPWNVRGTVELRLEFVRRVKFRGESTSRLCEVARLHLKKLGVTFTEISEQQSKYLSIAKSELFKPEHYRY